MLIRSFLPEDGPGVIDVVRTGYDSLGYTIDFGEFDVDLVSITSSYSDSGGAFWVLDDGGIVAGCIGATRESAGKFELHRLYRLPSYRGKGVGRKLIETAVSWCRSEGCEEIFLWSDVKFETAREVYIRCGFTPTQRTRAIDPVNPGCVDRLFVMNLSS